MTTSRTSLRPLDLTVSSSLTTGTTSLRPLDLTTSTTS